MQVQYQELGEVPPDEFICLAEENSIIHQIDLLVFEKTCAQLKIWQRLNPSIFSSVNFCPRYFASTNSATKILAIIAKHQINPKTIKIELTERVFLNSDAHQVKECLETLVSVGVQVCIDDFGTGYSSLSYFLDFCQLVQIIKIDKKFIDSINSDKNTESIVKTIIDMARSMGIKVVAEGIETPDQLKRLDELGCHFGQGYLIGKPESGQSCLGKYLSRRLMLCS